MTRTKALNSNEHFCCLPAFSGVSLCLFFSAFLWAVPGADRAAAQDAAQGSAQGLGQSLGQGAASPAFQTPAELGEALFFDTDLSLNRSQSCASCHAPEQAFSDPRETRAGRAVSLGDDGQSIGLRNAPSLTYASLTPAFHLSREGHYTGGQFWDGRATDLAQQAGGPPVNPLEMAMPDRSSVVKRLKDSPYYSTSLRRFYGDTVLDNSDEAYRAMTLAIAAFLEQPQFSSFDSKYDRWLSGDYQMTPQEDLGRLLFFSEQFTNCNKCHQLRTDDPLAQDETFTNYRFHNIGVPPNPDLLPGFTARAPLSAMKSVPGWRPGQDGGLAENPQVDDPSGQIGRFKVPGLRNVAVTGPYMHNGIFSDLRTVILFYDHFNSRSAARRINPETGAEWQAPEFPATLSLSELEHGPALDDRRIDALVAFLRTLTDARYEGLLDN